MGDFKKLRVWQESKELKIAIGSLTELESHLIIGQEIGIIKEEDYLPIMDRLIEIARKLTGLLTTLIASVEESQRRKPARNRTKL